VSVLENPYSEVDKKVVSDIYTSSEPLDNLKVLCDIYGSRFPGTSGDLGSVQYMVEKLKSYGVENAHYESYTIPGWKRGAAKLTAVSPTKREIDCLSLPHSIAGQVEGKLVWLGDGAIESYDKRRNGCASPHLHKGDSGGHSYASPESPSGRPSWLPLGGRYPLRHL
jgi:hypothetical protein